MGEGRFCLTGGGRPVSFNRHGQSTPFLPPPISPSHHSGHCKNLEPKYNTLGEKFVGVDHVMVAKIDFPVCFGGVW